MSIEFPKEIERIYIICHRVKEKERYERLVKHFKEVGMPLDMVDFCAPIWSDELTSDLIFKVYDPFLPRPSPGLTFKGRGLSKGEISLGVNFFACIQNAVEKKYKKILVFESDIWLRSDFIACLTDLLEDLKTKEWDYVSLGEGVGTRPEVSNKSYFAKTKAYTPPHQLVYRCTDSMMFQLSYIEKIVSTFIPFREIIDWEMNFQNMVHRGNALWADPPLAEQGTCYSRLLTSLPA